MLKKSTITIDDIDIEVTRKRVKNLNLRIYPPDGRVSMSVPLQSSEKQIRQMLLHRLEWIKKHRQRIICHQPPPPLSLNDGAMIPYAGKQLPLEIIPTTGRARITLLEGNGSDSRLQMRIDPATPPEKRLRLLQEWYRRQLKAQIPAIIAKYEPQMGVSVAEFGVKRMRTKWGTCNITKRRIWLNLELAKMPPENLEYVVVHEMVHLLERYHNRRFYGLMDRFMPGWREIHTALRG